MSSQLQPESKPSTALPRPVPAWIPVLAWMGITVGLVAFGSVVRSDDPAPAWRALLVNFLFWTSLAQGAVIWSVIFRVARTSWSGPVNRIGHAACRFLPFCLLAFAGLYLGRQSLFPWMKLDMGDRAVWLNARAVFLRDGIGLVVLAALSWSFVRTYLLADAAADPRRADRRLSVLGVVLLFVYMIVFSLLGFDLVMSLTPGWYSALYGWYFLLGGLYLGIAWLAIMAAALRGWFGAYVGAHGYAPLFRDLGNLVLAFAMAMTYFFYSQALPIWYENLPPETSFAILRAHFPPWQTLSWTLIFTCYLGVFALLVIREVKERPASLAAVGLLVLASMWLERYLSVVPSLAPLDTRFPALAIAVAAGFLGVLVLTTVPFLARHPAASPLDLALAAEREKWE